ncbi:hypothetical protein BB558_005029 [Smittium angustum]|uniref:CS domain-containing protein n=1 Tax=Smittium angustum TaxID=133377 RepID=A0A2U1J1M4_SMIAN|nr:hypothetical protein BB558_005029 [Smittium angustum]
MITPKFKVTQDTDFIYISIHVLHIRAKEIEFDVEGKEFRFFANPYYLRLKFPAEIVEDEESKAQFDVSEGCISVKLGKANKGENFPDLDLLSVLLATKTESREKVPKKSIIEVLDDNTETNYDSSQESEYETDWEIPQEIEEDIILKVNYGFNNQYNGWFVHADQTPNEINDIPEPESTTNKERGSIQKQKEDNDFNEEYYMNNYINDEEIEHVLKYEPWEDPIKKLAKKLSTIEIEKDELELHIEQYEDLALETSEESESEEDEDEENNRMKNENTENEEITQNMKKVLIEEL